MEAHLIDQVILEATESLWHSKSYSKAEWKSRDGYARLSMEHEQKDRELFFYQSSVESDNDPDLPFSYHYEKTCHISRIRLLGFLKYIQERLGVTETEALDYLIHTVKHGEKKKEGNDLLIGLLPFLWSLATFYLCSVFNEIASRPYITSHFTLYTAVLISGLIAVFLYVIIAQPTKRRRKQIDAARRKLSNSSVDECCQDLYAIESVIRTSPPEHINRPLVLALLAGIAALFLLAVLIFILT